MFSSSNWFDKYIKIHSWVTLCLFLAHFLYIIFAPEFGLNFCVTGFLILVVIIGCGILSWLGTELIEVMQFQQRKYILIIILTIITVSGFVPRVGIFYIRWNYYGVLFSSFFFLWFPINFHYIVHILEVSIDLFYAKRPVLLISIASIHIILLITSIRLATALSTGWDTVTIIVFQVLFAPLSLFANIDMVMAVVGSGVSASQVVPVGEQKDDSKPSADCHICCLPYSSKNPPRILKECGHTVCTDCATKLLAQHKNLYVVCPVCRLYHFVQGDVSRLPINHVLLDLMKVVTKKTSIVKMSFPSNWFDTYFKYHILAIMSLFFAHILYVIFAPELWMNLRVTILLFVVILVPCLVLTGLGKLLLKFKKFQQSLKLRKYVLIVILGIITLGGFLSRVGVFFVGLDYYILLCSSFFFLVFPIFFYCFPLSLNVSFKHSYSNWSFLVWILISIHICLLIVSIRLATYFSTGWDAVSIIVFQVLFAPMSFSANIDMIMTVVGSGASPPQVVPVGEQKDDNEPSGADCHICCLPYSSKNPPRILKECGHTVCTGCVAKLLAEYNDLYVDCPVCRVLQVVKGDASRLPINYALLDLLKVVEKMK